MRRALVCVISLSAACRHDDLKQLVGEVHIHEFAGGVHPAALFVRTPTPAASVDGDTVLVDPAARRDGDCVIARSSDAPLADPPIVDGGKLRILGGAGIGHVELTMQGTSGYLPIELPHRELFAGGERITIEAEGGEAPAFRGSLMAPARLELLSPTVLRLPLIVRWKPDRADRMVISLVASRSDGQWTALRCLAADAAGEFRFPSRLLTVLPPEPRDLQLEVRRDRIVRVPTAQAGTGVILHASFAASLSGRDP